MSDDLRDIVSAATPGPWEYVGGSAGYESVYAHRHQPSWVVADARDNGPADAHFIATFDPVTVSRLLDVLDAARAVDGDWCDGFQHHRVRLHLPRPRTDRPRP